MVKSISRAFPKVKILWYAQNSSGFKIPFFSIENIFFPIHW